MTKRFLALLLALIMCLSLAACGGDKDSEEEKKDEEKIEQTEKEQEKKKTPADYYNDALKYLSENKDNEAYKAFVNAEGYSDSAEYLKKFEGFCSKEITSLKSSPDETLNIRTYEYDEYGRVTKSTLDHKTTGNYEMDEYTYDKAGNVIEHRITPSTSPNEAPDPVTYRYEYDANNNCIKESFVEYYTDGTDRVTEFVYDSSNRLVKKYVPSNAYIGYTDSYEYKYDNEGKLVKEIYTDTYFAKETIIEYSYNENGLLIKKGNESFKYDNNGNLINHQIGPSDNYADKYTYEYDTNNVLIKSTYNNYITIYEYGYNYKG